MVDMNTNVLWLWLLLVVIMMGQYGHTLAFQTPKTPPLASRFVHPPLPFRTPSSLVSFDGKAVTLASQEEEEVETETETQPRTTRNETKKRLLLKAAANANGAQTIEGWIRELETLNETKNPAQSEGNSGTWRVRYTTAPPPSNGQLGPFVGTALQTIDLSLGLYANELLVGGESECTPPWLSATLLADWEDLEDGSSWKVNFRTITLSLSLWGRRGHGRGRPFDVWTKEFQEGTSRVWITTYLDEDMRIVRAGPTESEAKRMGQSADVKDYFVFVMTREDTVRSRTVFDRMVQTRRRKFGLWDVLVDPTKFMDDE